MVETEETDGAAPGWDAIDAALTRLYPQVQPKHYGTLIKWRLGGPDPLDGISFYPRDDHWHAISYGMSEVYAKQSENADVSGWGFEFTFRLARLADQTEPPPWAANFLQNLARYVFTSGNPFGPGHHMDLNGPISLADPDTAIRAIVFAEDPELGPIDTPHGRLHFLQVVGLTLAEYAAIERWDADRLLQLLAPHLPLLVTDLTRASLTDDPRIAATIAEGVRRDGSSTGSLYVAEVSWRTDPPGSGLVPESGLARTMVSVGANAARRIGDVVAGRLPFGRRLDIDGPEGGVALRPGDHLAITDLGDGRVEIALPPPVVDEMVRVLQPPAGLVAGVFPLTSAPTLTVQIVKSQIRDQDGNVVTEIG